MKNNCFNCEFYGRCAVNQNICNDWSNKLSTKPVLDILNFNTKWQYVRYMSIYRFLLNITTHSTLNEWLINKHEKSLKKMYNRNRTDFTKNIQFRECGYISFWIFLYNNLSNEQLNEWLLDKHNKSFQKWFNNKNWIEILKNQLEINEKFLSGKSVDDYIDEATEKAHAGSIEKMKGN